MGVDRGLVTVLRQIHDEPDEAVLEAYGWSDLFARDTGIPACSSAPAASTEEAGSNACITELFTCLAALRVRGAPATSQEAIADPGSRGYPKRVIFEEMLLWMDPVRRPGPEAMAVDEWLLETAELPVLRVYGWQGEWASVGYFGEIAAARAAFPGVDLVRRWTGGGMVDHRADWTYTIVAPHGEPLAGWRGAESYRRIHTALAETLVAEGIGARVSGGGEETGAALCFENPVNHDLLGADGRKLAGAGQRRSRLGLLHQGSVAVAGSDGAASKNRAEALADRISKNRRLFTVQPDSDDLARRTAARYAKIEWTERR